MAPVVAVNVPDVDDAASVSAARSGPSAIRCPASPPRSSIPTPARVRSIGQEGLLLVNGPEPDARLSGRARARRAEVLRDGWYVTGDIAAHRRGRLHPHHRSAVALQQDRRRDGAAHEGRGSAAGAAGRSAYSRRHPVADPAKGERLVAFYTDPDVTAQALWEGLSASELPQLWIPKREDLRFVEAIPTLGTGKVDLRRVKELAAPR